MQVVITPLAEEFIAAGQERIARHAQWMPGAEVAVDRIGRVVVAAAVSLCPNRRSVPSPPNIVSAPLLPSSRSCPASP